MNETNQTLSSLYQKSEVVVGGVLIKEGRKMYYYDLNVIQEYIYREPGYLEFRMHGKQVEVTNRVARALHAALLDWHAGKIV